MLAGSIVVAAVLFAGAGLPLYVFPPSEEIRHADLIYVIGPPRPERVEVERALRKEGVAARSLYSVSLIGGFTAERMGVCDRPAVACEHPEPYTTKGEAALLTAFADEHGIDRTVVITFTPHVARTRYIFEKCYEGDVTVVPVDEQLDAMEWIEQYFYQTAAFVKAWLTPCAELSDLRQR